MQYKPSFERVEKKCEYPECQEIYKGTITSKYCKEHKKPSYRKIIDKDKIREKKEKLLLSNTNQIIKHSFKQSIVIKGKCQLEGCGKDFDILVIPNTFTYPKFCEDHRSEYKRERFLINGKRD